MVKISKDIPVTDELINEVEPIKDGKRIRKKGSIIQNRGEEDSVEISKDSELLLEARKEADSIAYVREKKVLELKDKIENGLYNPSDREIAEKMVDSGIIDELV